MSLLSEIQQKLKAPKSNTNSFGGYKYRSCEDILEAVKPLLGEATLVINDDVIQLGDRYYVKATATLISPLVSITVKDARETWSATAFAREPLEKKGSDASQITGAASSYARKYALNGLFLIDDTKDADATNDHGKGKSDDAPETKTLDAKATQTRMYNDIMACKTIKELDGTWSSIKRTLIELPVEFRDALEMAYDNRKGAIEAGDDSPVGQIFNGVDDSRAKAKALIEEMDRMSTPIELSNWLTLNMPTINNLKGTSKAGTDKELFMKRVSEKREVLLAASKSLTAAG